MADVPGDKEAISRERLREILEQHKKWLESEGEEGQRANLKRENLAGADLVRVTLERAELSEADLSNAQLGAANLTRTSLWGQTCPVPTPDMRI